jgi:hypothetical protein
MVVCYVGHVLFATIQQSHRQKKHCREENVSLKIMCEIKFTSIYTIVQGVAALAALWARER